jgi:hypothetical protein
MCAEKNAKSIIVFLDGRLAPACTQSQVHRWVLRKDDDQEKRSPQLRSSNREK